MLEKTIVCGGWKVESGQRGATHGAPPRGSVGKYLRNVADPDMDDKRPACDRLENRRK